MNATTIPMDEEVARLYAAASPQERLKIEVMLQLGLREYITRPRRSYAEVADELGRQAAANGLTEEKLAEILRDD